MDDGDAGAVAPEEGEDEVAGILFNTLRQRRPDLEDGLRSLKAELLAGADEGDLKVRVAVPETVPVLG